MRIFCARIIIVLALFGLTYAGLQEVSGVKRTPIVKSLSGFPHKVGEWRAVSARKSSEDVIQLLGVDDYIELNYTNDKGQSLNFYAAFYESVGTGGGYHSPKNCIPGGGWGISKVRIVDLVPKGQSKSVKVSEMVIRNGNEYQVIYYWYQNRGRIIYSEYWEKIYLVLDAVLKGRRDGTFVRLMTTVRNEDFESAGRVLERFAGEALTELNKFLPGK